MIDKDNSGTFLTRKLGFQLARGDFIFNLDADDYLEPKAIEQLVTKLLDENADIVIGNHYQVINGGKRITKNKEPLVQTRIEQLKSLFRDDFKGYIWGRLFKKELLEKLDYEVSHLLQEDFLINLHVLIYHPVKISVLENPIYNYVVHPKSANSSRNPVFIENVYSFVERTEKILRDAGLFQELKEEFELFKCRNWIVYARLGGKFSRDKSFRRRFFTESFTENVKQNLAFHHKLEMMAYCLHPNMAQVLTRSMKRIDSLIH